MTFQGWRTKIEISYSPYSSFYGWLDSVIHSSFDGNAFDSSIESKNEILGLNEKNASILKIAV